ncbi:MAG TPA: long-chain fatty acid--CoA ligase [Actinomycetota bacterium]|nr:long-chain fatty acid--CoA ligase [Actinomycetota bacterium]
MKGLMQDYPLTIQHIFWRAEKLFPEKEVVTRTPDGVHRYTLGDFAARVRRLAGALRASGIKPGDRVGTFCWNTYQHHELYYAVPCIGAVLHTVNVRLFSEQIAYIVNHAEDRILFFDASLEEVLGPLVPELKTVEKFVRIGSASGSIEAENYEEFLLQAEPVQEWPQLDENDAAGMCYTSGTTGNPKGVVYSHRSTLLHAFGLNTGSGNGLRESDVTLAIVPMFHAMAWGQPYTATMAGCKQVYPGPHLDPVSLLQLIAEERVTFSAGVPTIWAGVLNELGNGNYDTSSVRVLMGGGSAVPRALIEGFSNHGLTLVQGWGMTETSPVAAMSHVKKSIAEGTRDRQLDYAAKTGIILPGVEFRIVGDDGKELPWDGVAFGELQVRGPWIASSYYNDERSPASFTEGWLRTGDVATVDELGYIQLVDRTKDLVKSGGEWISSVELEVAIMEHPRVLEAAVIAIEHSKWTERPLACVVLKPGEDLSKEEVIEFLEGKVAKWWLPDDVAFIDEVPKTSVGKFDKKVLRDKFAGYKLPTDE